jgi:hypothetical protein
MWCRRLSLAFKAVNSKFVCGNQELGIRTRVHLVNSTQNQGWVGDILRLGLNAKNRRQLEAADQLLNVLKRNVDNAILALIAIRGCDRTCCQEP